MLLIIGIVLTVVGLTYLCWVLFTLAVYALPLFIGASVAFAAYDAGSGPIAAFIFGLIGSGIILAAAQFVIARVRSPSRVLQFRSSLLSPLLSQGITPLLVSPSSGFRLTSGNTSWRSLVRLLLARRRGFASR